MIVKQHTYLRDFTDTSKNGKNKNNIIFYYVRELSLGNINFKNYDDICNSLSTMNTVFFISISSILIMQFDLFLLEVNLDSRTLKKPKT